jgi:NADPH:quinone reductase-like Zn-dependent oxidoreductase
VNPADIQYVNGVYEHAPENPMPRFPCPLGVDGAGVVTAVGSKVKKIKPGDEVCRLHQCMDEGIWAEIAAFEESELAFKPQGMCWQLAAVVPVAGVTALSALLCYPALKHVYMSNSQQAGDSSSNSSSGVLPVLILGASGGVGSFAVLLAKHFFRIPLVLATCSGRNSSYVRQWGADVVVDYTSQDVETAVLEALQQQQQQQQQQQRLCAAAGTAAECAAGHSCYGS